MKSCKKNGMSWGLRLGAVALVGSFLAWTSVATASITSWDCCNDNDGAINCAQTDWWGDAQTGYNVKIAGEQFWGPGHMLSTFTTDTVDDPTIKYINAVTNDTGLDWTGYVVNVTLNAAASLTTYSISNVTVGLPDGPDGWSVTNIPSFTSNGIVDGQYQYVATIDFQGGTPVAGDGSGELDFSYKVSFAGSTSYHAIQEQTPVPVPEPGTLVLVLGGLLGLAIARVAHRQA